jgi:hypothetical protein
MTDEMNAEAGIQKLESIEPLFPLLTSVQELFVVFAIFCDKDRFRLGGCGEVWNVFGALPCRIRRIPQS